MLDTNGEATIIKITVEAHDEKATFEFSDEADFEDLIEKFACIAKFLTYADETINEYLYPPEENEEKV
jgi:hypothetical protein